MFRTLVVVALAGVMLATSDTLVWGQAAGTINNGTGSGKGHKGAGLGTGRGKGAAARRLAQRERRGHGMLHVEVVRHDGKAAGGAVVRIRGRRSVVRRTNGRGGTRAMLPAGTYAVMARGRSGATGFAAAGVRARGHSAVTVVLHAEHKHIRRHRHEKHGLGLHRHGTGTTTGNGSKTGNGTTTGSGPSGSGNINVGGAAK